jgi:ubiquinone/menaquinone biosynthesis C-methylase UbiE
MDDAGVGHYERGAESGRLVSGGLPRLEFVRTLELLGRFLPPPPADILDVGGGPGVYAATLARQGYRVALIDVMPLHVEQAAAAAAAQPESPFEVRLGDARALDANDASCDAVLLLGPLYHLTSRADRIRALGEAHRVLRPEGVVIAVAISRFASLLDGLAQGFLSDPVFAGVVEHDLRDGQHRNPKPVERPEWFTTAFFHHPDELIAEVVEAQLGCEGVFGVEGPGWVFQDRWESPDRNEILANAARAVEDEPTLRAASAHLLAVGRKSR